MRLGQFGTDTQRRDQELGLLETADQDLPVRYKKSSQQCWADAAFPVSVALIGPTGREMGNGGQRRLPLASASVRLRRHEETSEKPALGALADWLCQKTVARKVRKAVSGRSKGTPFQPEAENTKPAAEVRSGLVVGLYLINRL